MSDRIATVQPVSETSATGRVAQIYADIKKTKNIEFVPNFWRVLATNPDLLDLVWTRLKFLMHPEAVGRASKIDALTRELIALAVSATNGCSYCIHSHTANARAKGMSEEEYREVLAIVGMASETNRLVTALGVPIDEAYEVG